MANVTKLSTVMFRRLKSQGLVPYLHCSNPPFPIELSDIEEAILDGKKIKSKHLSHWWGLLAPVIKAAASRDNPHPDHWPSTAEYVIDRIGRIASSTDDFKFKLKRKSGVTHLASVTWHGSLCQGRLWTIAFDLLHKFDIPFEVGFEIRNCIPSRFGRFSSEFQYGTQERTGTRRRV
ncbi:hypothetical protein [Mesorhizobium sp.]|uniref:hypothetical protein n=1 Tax=Mesorhizobium sp. TaxID=1871066 RepID=UPI000FEA13C3|nr:hypothetical protein [Mesorhizobium sp.]RWP37435.1 MAG: hypothetical protein EOR03_05020 [Mesorhizobium sp.]